MTARPPAGLCDGCRWRRDVESARSTFVLCSRGLTDPSFPKYPRLPVLTCRGYEPSGVPEPPEAPRS